MKKIIIIGEQCIDEFIYCEVNRLSPEAPVPVLNPVKTTTNNGMAGNVYENVCVLDKKANVILISQDKNITKTRYVDVKSNHMFLRVDTGEGKIDRFITSELSIKNSLTKSSLLSE